MAAQGIQWRTRAGAVVPLQKGRGSWMSRIEEDAVVKTLLTGVLVIALVLAVAACGGAEDKAAEEIGEAIGGNVEIDDDTVTITTDEGEATISGGEGALAEGFPEEFPIYDGATVKASAAVESGGKTQYSATLSTSDSVTDVYDWYKSELSSDGWAIENDMHISTGEGESAVLAAKKSGMEAAATIAQDDGATAIVIALMVEG